MRQIVQMVIVFIVAMAFLLGMSTLLASMAHASMATDTSVIQHEVPIIHYGTPSESWITEEYGSYILTHPRDTITHDFRPPRPKVLEAISPSCTPVPIPPSVWLLASGFIGLWGIARRRK